MYRVRLTEPGIYTVGYYEDGEWHAESDHGDADSAAQRASFLNGGARQAATPGGDLASTASLREWYAGQALVGLLSTESRLYPDDAADLAFRYADAMIQTAKK